MKTKLVKPVLVNAIDEKNVYNILSRPNGNIFKCNTGAEYRRLRVLGWIPKDLILISLEDKKIEVGDTLLLDNEEIVTCVGFGSNNDIIKIKCRFEPYIHKSHFKKVIATQSQISPEYISEFVEPYHNGTIKDVEFEMEEHFEEETSKPYTLDGGQPAIKIIEPILTNGFVTIINKGTCDKCVNNCKKKSTITDEFGSCAEFEEPVLYTEEEVLALCKYSYNLRTIDKEVRSTKSFNEWFNQNKKKQ